MSPTHRRRLIALLALAVLLLVLALVWQFNPAARQLAAPDALLQQAARLGWGTQLGLFVLAGCLAVPLSLIVLLAVLLQGPLDGALSSLLVGALVGLASFGAGALLGREAVAKLLSAAGPRLQALQALHALVARRGFLAVFIARLVPAAPFAVVSLMLGVTPIRWPVFLAGTLLGMLPMVGATAWLAPEILQQLRQPTRGGWLFVLVLVALVAALSWGLRRWAQRA